MNQKNEIKAEALRRGKRIKDFASDYPMSHSRLYQILNGFILPPADFDIRIRAILKKWDSETRSVVNRG